MFYQLRRFENIHIVLWLIKDTCWLMQFRLAGALIVIPTILMAFVIAYKTRSQNHLFLPNMAVCFWILANGIWMLGEFFLFNFRTLALILFGLGFIVIGMYFFLKPAPPANTGAEKEV